MGSSIALVALDTLRYDTFEEHFDWLEGLRFTNAYSTSHWTVPAHGSLFTGKYPSEIGVHSKSPSLDCPDITIAELLEKAGYTTRLWSANPNLMFWEGWSRGFDEVLEPGTLNPDHEDAIDWTAFLGDIDTHSWTKYPKAIWHAVQADCSTFAAFKQGYRRFQRSDADGGATDVLARARDTNIGEQEFLFVNLMETHTPYHPPKSSDGGSVNVVIGDAFSDAVEDPELIRAAYDSSAAYLSAVYEEIFDELTDQFDYVITVSDHGEMLGEDGMWNHGYGLYKELVHVPVVVSGTDVEPRDEEATVSLLDVHRTIAELADCTTESRGRMLLEELESRSFLTEFNGFLDRHRKQFERKGVRDGIFEKYDEPLYGLAADPDYYGRQTADGFESDGSSNHDDPRTLLAESLDERDVRSVTEQESDVSDEVKDRLEKLGYA